jgi:protein-L-isoaspartate(D-aspartate) O-methyltransferase
MLDPTAARHLMVESQLRARGISDERVLNAMLRVPRHEFVPDAERHRAYEDSALVIGADQTISQPYVVALMLEDLSFIPTDKVLEVGTGSGYVTALLAELAAEVFSIERHAALADAARSLLMKLNYSNVQVFIGDGTLGLPAAAPFDAILVSAAASAVPAALPNQLREGGRMMIPVGSAEAQQLQLIRRIGGNFVIAPRDAVRFVPLIAGQG